LELTPPRSFDSGSATLFGYQRFPLAAAQDDGLFLTRVPSSHPLPPHSFDSGSATFSVINASRSPPLRMTDYF
jgi:hypothetical protein